MSASDINVRDREVWLGGQKVGYTKGGVDFSLNREFTDIIDDRFGNTPLDKALTGQRLFVKVRMTELTPYMLSKAIPEGDYDNGSADDKLGFGSQAGYLLGQDAVELRLHPRNRADSDRTQDIFIFKAVSTEALEIPFRVDEQTVVEVTFEALVDEARSDGSLLGRIGPDAIS